MLVQYKSVNDELVIGPSTRIALAKSLLLAIADRLPLLLYPKSKKRGWALGWIRTSIESRVEAAAPDLVNLHWVCGGFVPIRALTNFNRPLVWQLHDSWAFTGGCHLPGDCLRYRKSCGACPQLGSHKLRDLSRWVWEQKKTHWGARDITVVSPSNWLAECARASGLLGDQRVEVIPHGLDTTVFKPMARDFARKRADVVSNDKIILMGAIRSTTDKNKGFDFLQPTLKRLAEDGWGKRAELVVFGAREPRYPRDMGLKTTYVGRLDDDAQLAALYSAADVFVAPSIQEAFGLTVLEALACGTPVVAFEVGGIADMVEHKRTGYLASPFDTDDLATGISWVIEDKNRNRWLSEQARKKVENEFAIEKVAGMQVSLYEEILKHKK